jgi:hypothetical protein
MMRREPRTETAHAAPPPSWLVGLCGLAAVASLFFSVLLFFNH